MVHLVKRLAYKRHKFKRANNQTVLTKLKEGESPQVHVSLLILTIISWRSYYLCFTDKEIKLQRNKVTCHTANNMILLLCPLPHLLPPFFFLNPGISKLRLIIVHLFLKIKFYWNTAMPIPLCIIYAAFACYNRKVESVRHTI